MKNYLIEISNGEPAISGKAVYEYDNLQEAVGSFHSKMGTAMHSELYSTELLMVVDETGKVLKRERFEREIQEQPSEEE